VQIDVLLAERMLQGAYFLIGDAAHTHSPAGGQGMNTGIQDAVNLAGKLYAVLVGGAIADRGGGHRTRLDRLLGYAAGPAGHPDARTRVRRLIGLPGQQRRVAS
jgi:flavin-dependent dehydrogenase